MRSLRVGSLLLLAVCASPRLFADTSADTNSAEPDTTVKNGFDLAVPDSPAFAVLGISPQTISTPASPRALAVAVYNGLDPNGNVQTGLALDVSPYILFGGADKTIRDYQKSKSVQAGSRFMVSIGTSKGSDTNDKAMRAALGLRYTVFDRGDPRLDSELVHGITAIQRAVLDEIGKLPSPEAQKEALEKAPGEVEKRVDALRTRFREAHWNDSSLVFGVAPTWTSNDGVTQHLSYSGLAAWGAWSLKMGKPGQFVLGARYRNGELVPDPTNSALFIERDSELLAGRFRFGNASSGFLAEGAIQRSKDQDADWVRSSTYTIGGELRVADNLWLQVGVGSSSAGTGQGVGTVTGQLKWAIADRRAYGVPN